MRNFQFSEFKRTCLLGLLIIGFAILESHMAKAQGIAICNTPECIETGIEIKNNTNPSVNPCNNFYEHACGGWAGIVDVSVNLMVQLSDELTALAEEVSTNYKSSDGEALRKFTDYYHSCTNYAAVNAEGLKPLASIVNDNGGWPLALPPGKWPLVDRDLEDVHESYAKLVERPALFAIGVDLVDTVEPSEKRSYTVQLTLPGKRTDYITAQNVGNERGYVVAMAKEFAALSKTKVLESDISRDVEKMLDFGKSLKALNLSGEEASVTIDELQDLWDDLVPQHFTMDWLKHIQGAFDGMDVTIDSTEVVRLVPGNIIKQLGDLLKGRDLLTVVNYVHWNAITSLAPHASENMLKMLNGFLEEPLEETDLTDIRTIQCTYYHKMLPALSFAYVQKHKLQPAKTGVTEMAKSIQEALLHRIIRSEWMDVISKGSAEQKVKKITKNIGYPAWYYQPGIDEFYSDLEIDGVNYLKNIMNVYGFERRQILNKLRQPYDPATAKWPISPLAVLMPEERVKYNSIVIPAVLFQRPYYNAEVQEVLNYGGLGSLIGREMARAFDTKGVNYNAQGFQKRTWTDQSIASYNKKIQCFANQYNAYSPREGTTEKAIKIDGKKTVDENFADYLGAKIALEAYRSQQNKKGNKNIKIKSLRGISDDQLFFYSFSQSLCSSQDSYSEESSRSPTSVRVNGVVSNMPEFAAAFECKSGTPMNPEKKCDF